ncbi:MAG: UDP-N-acetylglucosamine 2-epimerase (non-hydrolyzing) [Verrucomicrobiales bacterium]
MKIVTVVGARPQFIKAAPVSSAFQSHGIEECLIHTGQHYDEDMSSVFFDEMGIPSPAYDLKVGSGTHGRQTGKMMALLDEVMEKEQPDGMLIYGDTNSTLAGALVAAKMHVPIAHVEAGLRSFNRKMPEEVNRVAADHLSSLLFCPTFIAVENLKREGIESGVSHVGDVMYDAALLAKEKASGRAGGPLMETHGLESGSYVLVTIHRAENTDDSERLLGIFNSLSELAESKNVLLPLHPRTKANLERVGFSTEDSPIQFVTPLGFLDMVEAEANAAVIVTDSGGVQKEAYFHRVPCVTLRPETEWVETVDAGWNTLLDPMERSLVDAVSVVKQGTEIEEYGEGDASEKIVSEISKAL